MKEVLVNFINSIVKETNPIAKKEVFKRSILAIFLSSVFIVILGSLNNEFINNNLINFETINSQVKSLLFVVAVFIGSYFIASLLDKKLEQNYWRNHEKKLQEGIFKEFISSESSRKEIKFSKILFENNLKKFFINDNFKELFIGESSRIFTDGKAGLNQYIDDNIYMLKSRKYLKPSYKSGELMYIVSDFFWKKLKELDKKGMI